MRVTQIAPGPVQWRDATGNWRDYDLALRPATGGWMGTAGPMSVALPGRMDGTSDGVVRVADDAGDVLQFGLVSGGASAAVAGDVATYGDALDGVDVRLRLIPDGVEEEAVVSDAEAARKLVYHVTLSAGLVLESADRGGLRVMRGKEGVFRIPAPTAVDDQEVSAPPGRYETRMLDAHTWEVTTVLDDGWIDAKERAWPVVVDPSVVSFDSSPNDDCGLLYGSLSSGTSNLGCSPVTSRFVGFGGVIGVYGSAVLRFNALTVVQSDAIEAATLNLNRIASTTTPPPLPIDVRRITFGWASTTPSSPWTPPADWADPVPDAQILPGANGAVSVDLTGLVDRWQRHHTSGGLQGTPNDGVVLHEHGLPLASSAGPFRPGCNASFPCMSSSFSSSGSTNPALRPLLEVQSWPAAAAGNAVISPGEGDLTGKRVKLQARALVSSVGTVRFQYIAGSQRTWTDIPLAALGTPTRGEVASTDIPVSGPTGDRRSDLVIWDLSAMPGGDVDGPVHVRAWLESPIPGDGGMTDAVNFRLDRRGIDGAPTTEVGPGELNLLSGEFSMTQTDVSINAFLQDLTLTRTHRSRGVAIRNADMFGPGWDASVEPDGGDLPYKGIYDYSEVKDVAVDRDVLDPASWNWELFFETFEFEDLQADIETVQETERFNYEYAVVEAGDGAKMTFTQVTDPNGNVTDWTPDDLHPGFALRRERTATDGIFKYTLTDPDGNVAVFLSEVASSPNARLSTFKQPGSPSALSYTYEASGTRQRLKTVTAPAPAGQPARSLTFTWNNVGTPAVPRVVAVDYKDGYSTTSTVAVYSYDSKARLILETDPRIGGGGVRNTSYHYNDTGQLDQVTPSGEATWNLAYTRIAGDSGPRLLRVSRAHPDGGTATSTIGYNVPLSGSGAPYDMSAAATEVWGQVDDLPWDAVAIWPQDTVPDLANPDYSKATIYYLDRQGLEVNVAEPGGAISTSLHDGNGNVIRELSPQGRAAALAAGSNSATVAANRSTLYQYAGNGVDLLATREPVTQITLANGSVVSGRRLTSIHYDEGAPPGGPYHLPTSKFRAVEPVGGGQVDAREQVRLDYSANGGMLGWTARHATKKIVDPNGRALTSFSILHPTYPVVEETRTPGAPTGGTTPDDQWFQYYGIGPSARVPSGLVAANCNNFTGAFDPPGFLCLRSEATLPDASVPRRWFDYNTLGQATALYEPRPLMFGGAGFRFTGKGYDAAGQLTSKAVSGGTGTAVAATSFTYDPATGHQLTAGSTIGRITRVFDSNGRLSQYTDASGTVTTYRSDLRGRVTSMTVDGVTTTYDYDDRDNLTSVNDPAVGSAITASYDLNDNLVSEAMPNGLVAIDSYDETDRPSLLSWTQTRNCSSNCSRARSEVLGRDADGRITSQRSASTQETLTYDSVGRLTQSDAVRLSDNRCVRRTYAHDSGGSGDSNLTTRSVWASSPGAACGSGTASVRTLTYDTADRVSSSGWTWDYFGRAIAVTAADSGGTGGLTAAYYTNDRVRALTLDGRTQTYTRDPLDRTLNIDSSGATNPTLTSTYHYTDDTDEPNKITLSDDTTSHDIQGPSGEVVATNDNGTLTYKLRDLQGSIVATASAAGASGANSEYDPFGLVTTSTSNVIDSTKGVPANGWLGAHQRPTDFGQPAAGAGGPIEMGARVYLPKVGRFLQVDPIDGGSLSAYDYAFQDPTNMQDLSGLRGGPGTVCLLRNGPIKKTKCNRHTIKAIRSIDNSWTVSVFKDVKAAWDRVKIFYDIGKCAFTLFKSRGVDATGCNSFGTG